MRFTNQCYAVTRLGERCRHSATQGHTLCWQHQRGLVVVGLVVIDNNPDSVVVGSPVRRSARVFPLPQLEIDRPRQRPSLLARIFGGCFKA
jgi:hypothetical protein